MNIDTKILKIHNYIYANEGLSNSETLNEFLKIFYCKILDEQNHKNFNNLDKLFEELKLKLKGIIDDNEKINLKKTTINFILEELKDINFSEISSDIKGHILQKIIDRSYRESRGQFFTPPQVVNFIIKMINPKSDEIGADIASGTGGFMFGALEHSKAPTQNVYFYDISKNLIKLVAMRMMFEYSQSKANYFVKNSISENFNQKFDYILINPPFGTQGKISDTKILSKYKLGKDFKTQIPDMLFVEKTINLLKPNGRAAIILPNGDFENPTFDYFRKYLIQNIKIDAIVSLPEGTFSPYGTNVQSSILFLTKTKPTKNYNVFFGQITKLGYTFNKHSKKILKADGSTDQDYCEIINNYKNNLTDYNSFTVSIKEIINNNYNLSNKFYKPEFNTTINQIKKQKYAKLKELVKFEYKKSKIDKNKTYRYIEITDINASSDEIINTKEYLGSILPSRASYILKNGDIIVSNTGSLIGTPKHAKSLINKEFDGIICTNGFTVMKPKKISPYYLMYYFRTKEFQNQVLKHKYGSAIPKINREDFENILIPIPPQQQIDNIEKQVLKATELRQKANEIIQNLLKD